MKTVQGSAPDKVIIQTKVVEKSTGELSFGAGFSTQDGVLGDIKLRERNFLGKGQDLSATILASQRTQSATVSFTEPYFLGRDLAAGFDLFQTRTNFESQSSFDETSTGGTLRLGYPLTENLRHSVRYTLRDDSIHNIDDDASVFIQDEDGHRTTSLVGQTFSYDRRDDRFLPSGGYFLKLDQDLAGLGGDNRFIRHEARAEYYYSIVPDVVFSVIGNGGYIKGFGGEDVHLTNRFFVGGANLVGFQFAGIGPRDSQTDDKLGGNLYYTGSAELRFPLGLPKELRVFGRTFVDAGSLSDIDVSGPTLDESNGLRVAAGVGLSWLSPLGPAVDQFRAGDPQGDARRDRVLQPELRHPVLMPRGAGRSAGHRRTLLTLALLAGSTAWPLGPAAAQDTLPPAVAAVIDYQRILRDARAARAIRDQVEARRKLYQDEIAKEEQRLHEADKELARQRSVLSADAFADQRSEFESDVAGVQRMAQERRRQLDQAAAAALSEVRTAMIQVVGELADSRGFNLVLPSSGLLVFSPKIDLTDEVLGRLDKKLPNVKVPEKVE